MPNPSLTFAPVPADVRAFALVLPGGTRDSFEPTTPRQLAGLRMRPFMWALRRSGARHGLASAMLHYRVRGWNGAEMSPVSDARWALAELRQRFDAPVVLIGHSMGGRTAVHVADEDHVVGVAGLAPWLTDDDPVDQLRGRRLLVAHGDGDTVTSPRASHQFAERARAAGADVNYVTVARERHAMLRRPQAWHRLTTAYVLDVLGLRPLPAHVRRAIERQRV